MFNLFTLIAQGDVDLGTFQPATDAYSAGSGDDPSGGLALANMETLISNLIGALTVVGSILFVVYFILGAFEWISSGGDKGKLEHARNRMMYGILGMIIIVGAYSLLGLLSGIIGLDFLNPAKQINDIVAPIAK
jgi:hypothetical protein